MRRPSAIELGRGLAALGLGLAALCAQSQQPLTSVERRLAVDEASVAARARLFELNRIAVPLCRERARWTLGMLPFRVTAEEPNHEQTRRYRQIVMQEFGAEPGDVVFTTTPAGMPFGIAGARRGDRIVAADGRRWNPFDELQARASAPEPRQTYLELVKELGSELEADPVRAFVLRRGGEQVAVSVSAVPACPVLLSPVDSQHEYAETDAASVLVTLPLLASLDEMQLTMVLANELSHVLLGHARTPLSDNVASILFGPLIEAPQNRELKRLPLADAELIQADRLTLWLLKAYGIRPRTWLEFLEHMESRGGLLQVASYARTRPLTGRRAEELRAEVALFESNGRLKLPKGVSAEALREVAVAAAQVRRHATVATAAPKVHAWQVPAASGFAAIEDVDRVPIRAEGKDRYRHYLTLPSPKAFFVAARGGWRFYADTPDAMAIGLDYCAREGYACWLYAVDDQVVWQEDPARRIGSRAALQPAR